MRLSSQGSQFVFNLPPNLVPSEIIQSYTPILEKNWIQYDNVIDYLNSTIKSVDFPGISFERPKQNLIRGKERYYKPAINIQDIVSSRDLSITFASVDADINYWLAFDIVSKNYLDVQNLYVKPFTITALDIHRDGIYTINFFEIILHKLSEIKFDYSQQKVASKEFTMTFSFNFYKIEFLIDNSKVLELAEVPTIIQKI
jgi:hypothetical protein